MGDTSKIAPNLRIVRILEIISQSNDPLTPTQINDHLRLPKQTIHRLCATLVEEGFLIRQPHEKGLRPSRRMREMASGMLEGSRFQIVRHQILSEVASSVSETVNYAVPEENGMVYKDRVETDWPFRIQLPVGTHVPFHCTASGKTFLAHLPTRARKLALENLDMVPLTENTITDREDLISELRRIRKQGYAIDNEEFIEGMVALAVPIFDERKRYCASIAFHGPTQRLSREKIVAQKDIMFEGAQRLSKVMFY